MKEKNYNSPWSLKFNTAALVLIPAAVGINLSLIHILPYYISVEPMPKH